MAACRRRARTSRRRSPTSTAGDHRQPQRPQQCILVGSARRGARMATPSSRRWVSGRRRYRSPRPSTRAWSGRRSSGSPRSSRPRHGNPRICRCTRTARRAPHPADVARSKRLMTEHLVQPVEFVEQIRAMHADGAHLRRGRTEVGAVSAGPQDPRRPPHVALAVDDGSGMAGLLSAIGQLFCAGVVLDIAPLFAQRDCRVGRADRLAELDRTEPVPKTAWWINGSGARRNTDPLRQIGRDLRAGAGAAQRRTAEPRAAAPAAPVSLLLHPCDPEAAPSDCGNRRTARSTNADAARHPTHSARRDVPMDDRRHHPRRPTPPSCPSISRPCASSWKPRSA